MPSPHAESRTQLSGSGKSRNLSDDNRQAVLNMLLSKSDFGKRKHGKPSPSVQVIDLRPLLTDANKEERVNFALSFVK
ncbi:hypothetical protein H257_13184 [Aphanomyces astaci]|uniref:Uncharacterized protein n=1 Tax=Aphanomyces astaci TaxID=112090 RepID=W4FX38_APHAT|nr:hypothetical protein H257_13184 [Aphanomyces astaci]ETV71521.1 hypothetical protein H257_13184 [Aphanomyces astaci]|eukprot:XP_009838954.1 hypothetical protein H257_13184 [Aphanomyces astaci]